MIRVENLRLRHGERLILDDVSFEVPPGETLAIIGESGGGKTSLARLLLGLLDARPDGPRSRPGGFRWSGRALLGEVDVLRAGRAAMDRLRGREAGLIVQALSDALNPHLTVRRHLREVLALRGERRPDVEKACDDWNIPERIRDRYPSGLSGGEIQRVLTALALLPRPRYLILDEPTASLDRQNRERAIRALESDRAARCQLLITHDLELARRLADRAAVLRNGRIVETGTAREVLERPASRYAASLLAAARGLSRTPVAAGPKASPRSPVTAGAEGLHVRDLTHSYGHAPVLDGLSFHVPKGSCLAVLGESGSGKSTLARILAGYVPLQSGSIAWADRDGAAPGLRGRAALVSQHPHRAMPRHFTVSEVLREAFALATPHDPGLPRDMDGRAAGLLELVGLPAQPDFLNRPTAALSGGEAQRLVIARALAAEPDYLIADEPTAALDMLARATVLGLLGRLRDERGLTIVLVTHEPDVAGCIADAAMYLPMSACAKDGRVAGRAFLKAG